MYNSKQTFFLFLLFAFFSAALTAQDFNGCITIDFETLPDGSTPTEGTFISDQYYADFGLTFELEDGTPPVLAEIGNPTTAFGSAFGNDTPAPNQDIGSFFLTDDGLLTGLNAIPVYLNFETPIDSFGGCILDMDFGELFIIEAMDSNGESLLVDTIFAGDPGTGDGLATCWGFNFSGCVGTVHSVRFEGQRETAGAFGLGLDNFSFCTGGVDIANEIILESEPLSCTNETSAITILNTGSGDYMYSLDGINFQSEPFFDDLPDGFYTVVVQDTASCEASFDWDIEFYFEPIIFTAAETNTSCGEDNGVIVVNADASASVTYSVDDVNFQESNVFSNLPPGTYSVTVIDEFGCFDTAEATIAPSPVFSIDGGITTDETCNDSEGTATITGTTNATGSLTYVISSNPGSPQSSPTFTDLPAGTYIITAIDGLGCEDTFEVIVDPGIQILDEVTADPQNLTCTLNIGSITMINSGTNTFTYSLDGTNFQNDPFFPNLPVGDYIVSIQDINFCIETISVSIFPYVELNVDNITPEGTICGEDNGSFTVTANNSNGITYSLNEGMTFQDENLFDSLPAGTYSILIMDEDGCTATGETVIDPSFPPVIDAIDVEDNLCDSLVGTINISASAGSGNLNYFLNNDTIPGLPTYSNLDGGMYLVTVVDEDGCTVMDTVEIITTPPVDVLDVFIKKPECTAINGVVKPYVTGGTGLIWYTLNDENPTPIDSFTNLEAGEYTIFMEDEFGCTNEVIATVPCPGACPVYVPNAFSPNGDGINDEFKIYTVPLYDAEVISFDVFDRWGEHVWADENFSVNTYSDWWSGMFLEEKNMLDVYVYVIKIRYCDGTIKDFVGDVTIIR